MSYQDYWLWSISVSECDSLDDPNCENIGTGAVYYGEEYPYEDFDYAEPIPHPFDTKEYEEDYIPEDPLPELETWPDLDPVTMDSNEASKIFFTCTFDLAPGVSKLSSLKSKYHISSYSFCPWIVSTHLCTVTFGFPNSKKNSFRGNYMKKYSRSF